MPAASTTAWMSSITSRSEPDLSADRLMTMSISVAPSATAGRGLGGLGLRGGVPVRESDHGADGDATAFRGCPRQSATQDGSTHAAAKPWVRASSHTRRASRRVESGFRSVWSRKRANSARVMT
jgi:hypothetical protein